MDKLFNVDSANNGNNIYYIQEVMTHVGEVIKVIGVGGGGCNAVDSMVRSGVKNVEFICANTDAKALSRNKAHHLLQLGHGLTRGLGAGSQPEIGKKSAMEDREKIASLLKGTDMLFIAAGMGGGTGTGAAPVVAEVAKQLGALTVAVVSKPFSHEGQKCLDIANEGLEELGKHVDSLIVILNEKLEEIYEDDSMLEWLGHADDVLNNAVAGIAEIINVPGHINVDFNDVKTIMAEQGKAMMGTAVASGLDRARIAAEQAVASPLLDGIDLSGARGVLVNVTASRSLKGKEIKQVMETVRAFAAPDASIAQGIAYDDAMGDEVRVTVVATGLGRARRPILVSTPVARTGTYDATPAVAASDAVPGANQTFEPIRTPAVWRREHASETVRAMERNGTETYDIPAFLRRQAD